MSDEDIKRFEDGKRRTDLFGAFFYGFLAGMFLLEILKWCVYGS